MNARRLVGALAAVTLAGLLALGGVRAQQPRPLVTRPSRASGVASIQLADNQRARRELTGAVATVTPWRPRELTGWWLVELTGTGAPEARRFAALGASRASIPLRVGDQVRATIDCTLGGFHYVCDGVVLNAASELIFAAVGSGGDGVVPGWRLTGHATRGVASPGNRILHTLSFEHAGGRTSTAVRGWTSVRAPDGEWLLTGVYSQWDPARERVPEAVDYAQYAITRVRR